MALLAFVLRQLVSLALRRFAPDRPASAAKPSNRAERWSRDRVSGKRHGETGSLRGRNPTPTGAVMDRAQAAALLGVEPSATVQEARKAFLARARIMHPDRFHDAPEADRAAAGAAMTQLNEAMEVFAASSPGASSSPPSGSPGSAPGPSVVACLACGQKNRVLAGTTSKCAACGQVISTTGSTPGGATGFAGEPFASTSDWNIPLWETPATACDFCGWGPARLTTIRSTTGVIIWFQWSTVKATLCKHCAGFVYNQAQAHSIVWGWWGLLAPVFNIIAMLSNLGSYAATRRLPEPSGRSLYKQALVPFPLRGSRRWFTRPLPLVFFALVAAFLLWVTGAGIWEGSTGTAKTSSSASGATGRDSNSSTSTSGTTSTSPRTVDSADLKVGQCTKIGDATSVMLVPVVPCLQAHTEEVFGIGQATESTFSQSSVVSQAEDICLDAFRSYVGTDIANTALTFSYIFPTAETWASGERTITCLLQQSGGAPTTGSYRGTY